MKYFQAFTVLPSKMSNDTVSFNNPRSYVIFYCITNCTEMFFVRSITVGSVVIASLHRASRSISLILPKKTINITVHVCSNN